MPAVASSTWINAPLDRVYSIAKDNSAFPEYMQDVESLTVIEVDGGRVVSDYVGIVSAFRLKVRWQQEDVWDDEAHTCAFRQLKGDYDQFEGLWSFREEKGGTRFESSLNYEYVVPGLGAMVGKVIQGLVQKNSDAVLEAIKQRAEAGS